MAMISKKTALVWVLIVAGAVTLWKFVWKPMQSEKMVPATSQVMEKRNMVATPSEGKKIGVRTHYMNPAGGDDVAFTLTIDASGVITDAATEVLAVNSTSRIRQQSFAEALPTALNGKKLSELTSIDRVGGSSLTTGAFNAALPQFQTQL